MKTYVWLVILSCLIIGACNKNENYPEPEREFFIRAKKDGSAWQYHKASAEYLQKGSAVYIGLQDLFYMFGVDTAYNNTPEEVLTLSFSLTDYQADQQLDSISAELTFLVGGDMIVDRYNLADKFTKDQIRITRIDTTAKTIEGNFDVILERDKHFANNKQYLHFTNGEFKVPYQVRE